MIVEVACVVCGGSFRYDQAGRGRRRRTCSAVCQAKRATAQNERYRTEGRYPRRPRAKTIPKVCVVCNEPFLAVSAKRQACDVDCGQILAKRNGDAGRRRNAEQRRSRTCLGCGAPFVTRNPSGAARAGRSNEGRFCSRACSNAHRRTIEAPSP